MKQVALWGAGLVFAVLVFRHPGNLFGQSAAIGYFLLLADGYRRDEAGRAANLRVAVLVIGFLLILGPFAQAFEAAARPQVIDGALRAVDVWLGLDGFAIARLCARATVAARLIRVVYGVLPAVLMLAWLASRSRAFLRSIILAGLAAVPFYLAFPAVGPVYVFRGWPAAGAVLVPAGAGAHPRNCMPSLHFTWAALTALSVRGRWRILFFVYAALMAVAAVASGEHYVVDVVAAVLYTMAVQVVSRLRAADVNLHRRCQVQAELAGQ